jgi:general secretion pathway protein D
LTGQTVPISDTLSAPVYAMRAAQSRVAIRDGQTIVIGGLMEDRNTSSISKVPVLGDIPGLGAIFQRRIEDKTKTELLIFITPHVALQPEELTGMSKDETAGAKIIDKAVEPGAFDEHMRGMERGASTRPADDQGDYRTIEPATPSPKPSNQGEPGEPNERMDLGE